MRLFLFALFATLLQTAPALALRLDDDPQVDDATMFEESEICILEGSYKIGLDRCEEIMDENCGSFRRIFQPYMNTMLQINNTEDLPFKDYIRRLKRLDAKMQANSCGLSAPDRKFQYVIDFWIAYGDYSEQQGGHSEMLATLDRLRGKHAAQKGAAELFDAAEKIVRENKAQYDAWLAEQERIRAERARMKAQCGDVWHTCYSRCAAFLTDSDGGFLASSSRDRCSYRCSDAQSACERGNMKEMEINMCQSMCQGANDENGGFLSSSSREKCEDRCRWGY